MIMITPIDVPDALPAAFADNRIGGNNTHVHGSREARGNVVRGNVQPREWDPLYMKTARVAETLIAAGLVQLGIAYPQ